VEDDLTDGNEVCSEVGSDARREREGKGGPGETMWMVMVTRAKMYVE
jgi:hypothetical protein